MISLPLLYIHSYVPFLANIIDENAAKALGAALSSNATHSTSLPASSTLMSDLPSTTVLPQPFAGIPSGLFALDVSSPICYPSHIYGPILVKSKILSNNLNHYLGLNLWLNNTNGSSEGTNNTTTIIGSLRGRNAHTLSLLDSVPISHLRMTADILTLLLLGVTRSRTLTHLRVCVGTVTCTPASSSPTEHCAYSSNSSMISSSSSSSITPSLTVTTGNGLVSLSPTVFSILPRQVELSISYAYPSSLLSASAHAIARCQTLQSLKLYSPLLSAATTPAPTSYLSSSLSSCSTLTSPTLFTLSVVPGSPSEQGLLAIADALRMRRRRITDSRKTLEKHIESMLLQVASSPRPEHVGPTNAGFNDMMDSVFDTQQTSTSSAPLSRSDPHILSSLPQALEALSPLSRLVSIVDASLALSQAHLLSSEAADISLISALAPNTAVSALRQNMRQFVYPGITHEITATNAIRFDRDDIFQRAWGMEATPSDISSSSVNVRPQWIQEYLAQERAIRHQLRLYHEELGSRIMDATTWATNPNTPTSSRPYLNDTRRIDYTLRHDDLTKTQIGDETGVDWLVHAQKCVFQPTSIVEPFVFELSVVPNDLQMTADTLLTTNNASSSMLRTNMQSQLSPFLNMSILEHVHPVYDNPTSSILLDTMVPSPQLTQLARSIIKNLTTAALPSCASVSSSSSSTSNMSNDSVLTLASVTPQPLPRHLQLLKEQLDMQTKRDAEEEYKRQVKELVINSHNHPMSLCRACNSMSTICSRSIGGMIVTPTPNTTTGGPGENTETRKLISPSNLESSTEIMLANPNIVTHHSEGTYLPINPFTISHLHTFRKPIPWASGDSVSTANSCLNKAKSTDSDYKQGTLLPGEEMNQVGNKHCIAINVPTLVPIPNDSHLHFAVPLLCFDDDSFPGWEGLAFEPPYGVAIYHFPPAPSPPPSHMIGPETAHASDAPPVEENVRYVMGRAIPVRNPRRD